MTFLRGVLLRLPTLDFVRNQDVGLAGAPDMTVLEWAAQNSRILITHDVNTLLALAYQRVTVGLPMPGVFAVPRSLSVGQAINDIVLLAECSDASEWDGSVRFLPL